MINNVIIDNIVNIVIISYPTVSTEQKLIMLLI